MGRFNKPKVVSLDPSLENLLCLLAGYLSAQVHHMDSLEQLHKGLALRAEWKLRAPLTQSDLGFLRCHAKYWVDKSALDSRDLDLDIGDIEQSVRDVGYCTLKLSYKVTEKPQLAAVGD